MQDYNKAAGQLLRKFRLRQGYTLKQAAAFLNTSAPVLSRKERGADDIERVDIRLAIEAYRLTSWEAHELWTAAGFIPEPVAPLPRSCDLREFAQTLLLGLSFPAFIMDILGYLRAWNESLEAIWSPFKSKVKPVHVVDNLFSERTRRRMGDRWESYASRSLTTFCRRTLSVANDPAFRELLAALRSRYGDEFVRKWTAAEDGVLSKGGSAPVDLGATIVSHESPYGMIEYLVVKSIFHLPRDYDLIMYVPLGEKNQETYTRFVADIPQNRFYFSTDEATEIVDGTQTAE